RRSLARAPKSPVLFRIVGAKPRDGLATVANLHQFAGASGREFEPDAKRFLPVSPSGGEVVLQIFKVLTGSDVEILGALFGAVASGNCFFDRLEEEGRGAGHRSRLSCPHLLWRGIGARTGRSTSTVLALPPGKPPTSPAAFVST